MRYINPLPYYIIPVSFVETFEILDGKPYPILLFAITLTPYSVSFLRCVTRHEVDFEMFNDVQLFQIPSKLVLFVWAM